MIILLIILIIAGVIICDLLSCSRSDFAEFVGIMSSIATVVLGIIECILIIVVMSIFTNGYTSKDKIKMYQEENSKIEEQIDILVKQYMDHEENTLQEFTSDSSITLVTMYPDLKSDKLVQTQIKTYTNNNNQIKELKEAQIDMKLGKWLLYFGK